MSISKSLYSFKSVIMILIGVLIFLSLLPLSFWNTSFTIFYIDILKPLISLLVAGLIIYTALWTYKNHRDVFKPWMLLSCGTILYFFANLLYFIFEDILGTIYFPSIADAIYLAAYPFLIIGILFFLKKPFKIRSKALLDVIIVMMSAFFIVWFPFIWPAVEPSQPDTLSIIISISYLFLDLTLLLVVLTVLFNENRKISELPLILLALGIFFQIWGDMGYAYYALNPSLVYKWLFNVLYISNMVLVSLAVISYLKNINIDINHLISFYRKSRAQNDWISYLPLILVIFAYGLLIITTPDEALIWGVGIIVLLVILRQIISLNEIKKAQETLKKSKELISKREEQLLFINSNTVDLITESDENGVYQYLNPSSNHLLGYSPQELIGKSFYDFIHPHDLDEISKGLKKAVESRSSVRLQYRYRNAENKYIWIETIGKPVFEDHMIKGFIYSSRDISERKKSEEFIKKSLMEKEALLREIHHRVNNNLQIISSLLSLQSNNVVSEKDRELFIESQNRVRSMALIHENLYQSEDLSSINFSNYLKSLLDNLIYEYSQSLSKIDLDLDLGEIDLNIETSIPCGLLINELVSNSLKHAFPGGREGKVTIKMHKENDKYVLTVGDDGVGRIKESDLKNGTTLGLRFVNSLVRQLDGDIKILDEKGTVYQIIFSELKYKERIK